MSYLTAAKQWILNGITSRPDDWATIILSMAVVIAVETLVLLGIYIASHWK